MSDRLRKGTSGIDKHLLICLYLSGMNELRYASVLVTFDASSCEASLNTIENINTYEKSKMPRGIERKIKTQYLYPHERINIRRVS